MPQFRYKAKYGPQKIIENTIEAENQDNAVAKIIQMGYTPVDVQRSRASTGVKDKKADFVLTNAFKRFRSKVPQREVYQFTRQLSDLIGAHVPMMRTLGVIKKQTRHQRFRTVMDEIFAFVQDGGTLSSALAQHPDVFSGLYVSIVHSGEISGNLEVVLSRLADFLEEDQEIRAQIRDSMSYPLFVLAFGILALFLVLTWFIPKITAVYEDLNQELPFLTTVILNISDVFARYWWLMIAVVSGVLLYFNQMIQTSSGKMWFDRLKLRIPVWGDFLRDIEIGRFTRTLATLTESGVVIVTALESVSMVMDNEIIKEEVKKITQQVSGGSSLTLALSGQTHFPDAVISMVEVGEQTGELHTGLHKLARYYERQTRRAMKQALSLIGPLFIVFIGSIIGVIVFAMLLPIFSMDLNM